MSCGIELVGDGAARKLNECCRHDMIRRLLADILVDMTVCDLEGWDKMEYINLLKSEIDKLTQPKRNKE